MVFIQRLRQRILKNNKGAVLMKIERMRKGQWNKVKAFFDLITEEGFTIKGFKLVDGINGMFVGFPSEKDKEGEYRDSVFASKELRAKLNDIAIKFYGSLEGNTTTTAKPEFDDVPF